MLDSVCVAEIVFGSEVSKKALFATFFPFLREIEKITVFEEKLTGENG